MSKKQEYSNCILVRYKKHINCLSKVTQGVPEIYEKNKTTKPP